MKKIIFLFLLILVGSIGYSQQALVLLYDNRELAPNEIITITSIDPESGVMKFPLAVKNTSTSDIQVKVRRIEMFTVAGSINYFCFVSCYTPEISVSPDALLVYAGDTVDSFYADYEPGTEKGTSEIQYEFFDANNSKSSTTVVARFSDSSSGLNNVSSSSCVNVSSSKDFISVSYCLAEDQTLVIRDITGKITGKQTLKAGARTEIIPFLTKGIYIYSVERENGISFAGKFIIH
jgi:hypothetical protein